MLRFGMKIPARFSGGVAMLRFGMKIPARFSGGVAMLRFGTKIPARLNGGAAMLRFGTKIPIRLNGGAAMLRLVGCGAPRAATTGAGVGVNPITGIGAGGTDAGAAVVRRGAGSGVGTVKTGADGCRGDAASSAHSGGL